ncbi:MAG: hypothetical protein V3S08_06030 [Phycisphaerales bacterium]
MSRARLAAALKQLRVHWDLVKAKWDDQVSADFERKFLQTLEPKIRAAATAMEKMEKVLAQARHDCG